MSRNQYWLDERGQLALVPSPPPSPLHVYRIEIRGDDDVSYIEAANIRMAIHAALYEFPHAAHVEIVADLHARDCTLAELAQREPGLFEEA
ncbi:MAG: hypothetical protein H6636_06890 [Anaerolineales bacterium]|nr:hypothetical protein [Anaerolineales bacterium]